MRRKDLNKKISAGRKSSGGSEKGEEGDALGKTEKARSSERGKGKGKGRRAGSKK